MRIDAWENGSYTGAVHTDNQIAHNGHPFTIGIVWVDLAGELRFSFGVGAQDG